MLAADERKTPTVCVIYTDCPENGNCFSERGEVVKTQLVHDEAWIQQDIERTMQKAPWNRSSTGRSEHVWPPPAEDQQVVSSYQGQ